MTDLLIRGGTVVNAEGRRRADVAVEDGTIRAIEADLAGLAEGAGEVVDATDLFVLPGAVDVHTHTRVASDAEPDRFFRDSVAAAFGGTTSFLSFNNPGTGASEAAGRSLLAGLREWRAATNADSAIDYGLSLAVTGGMGDPIAELPAVIEAGVPTCKAFMVFDFRLPDARLFEAIATMGARGGMLEVHCEDPVLIDAAVASALQRGNTLPRYHAETRPSYAEGIATARAIGFARLADAPLHVVHLSSADALRFVREAKASGQRVHAETCPHYLALTDERYLGPDDATVARFVISPPLRTAEDQQALWKGLAGGDLEIVATDHVPDRVAVEKAGAGRGISFDQISNGAPGIETLMAIVYSEGVATGRITLEQMVDLLATAPARLFGFHWKGAVKAGFDADLVLFDPAARRTLRAEDLHHTSDYTPYEGLDLTGAVRSVFVRGRAVVRDGAFVGQRGYGRFIEREGAG